jgi:hypothetical protein
MAFSSTWHFLAFSGSFQTRLRIVEDAKAMILVFELAPGSEKKGLMRKFKGRWVIEPVPGEPGACISTIEQDVKLGIWAPGIMKGMMQKICAQQVRHTLEDLQAEAVRMADGNPTLGDYESVKDVPIGTE